MQPNKASASVANTIRSIPRPHRSAANRKALWLGLAVVFFAVSGMGVWGSTAPLSSAVVAPGQIVVASKRKLVQHRDGGIVRKINVRDGDIVKVGDVLLELDDSEARLRHTLTHAAYYSALATKFRLITERDGRETVEFPAELKKATEASSEIDAMVRHQKDVFLARRKQREGQIAVLKQRIYQTDEEIHGHEAEHSATQEQSRIAKTEMEVFSELLKKGYTTQTRVSALEREQAALVGNAGKATAMIARAKANIAEAHMQILQVNKQFRSEVFGDLKEIEDKIYDLREKAANTSERLELLIVRAPYSGEVVNMQLSTVGGVIKAGDTALEIVPENDGLIVEARVRPLDVDQIYTNLETEVRITAFKQRTTPPLRGKVILVSADALNDGRTGEPYFVARISVKSDGNGGADLDRLQPGMPAEVMIKTGERTALAYMMQPILDSLNRAMRER